jgi:starch phosphorylase
VLVRYPGGEDLRRAGDQLAARLPSALAPFARLAYNYRWCWMRGGDELFAAVDPDRWEISGHNPVRLLQEASTSSLERAAVDPALCRRAYSLEECVFAEALTPRPAAPSVAFVCAEYGVHASLPIYAGGLGVLAGDLLKAASDRGLALVAVGLLYREGYFRQRIDVSGWQHEYWVETDPHRLPAALVTRDGVEPLLVRVPIRGREVSVQIWRVDVGRVPLYLLDADRPENAVVDRWITARLYVGDRETRIAQYALLGIGGVRALRAMGIEPGVLHLNEGHAALAALELAAAEVEAGSSFGRALAAARRRTVFTTHTCVPAGNETYDPAELRRALPGLPERLGTDWEALLALARVHPREASERPGMTALALRLARSANGVSRRHGEVARALWRPLFRRKTDDKVPIGSITNGVHVDTWMAAPMRELLDRELGPGFETRADDPAQAEAVEGLPDAALWAVRRRLREALVEHVRVRATRDRLARGEPLAYAELAAQAFDPDRLTIGFARRLATYKRLALVARDLPRALALLAGERPVQILLAGKAHPQDDEAKAVVQRLFAAKGAPAVGERIAYLHDYDMELARHLVAGCDVWVNLPRPPLEASGTSGMKAALNGCIHLSVLDGWWAEAFDGGNGWAIAGDPQADPESQDARDAAALLDLFEREVVPLFHDRDREGLPRGWLRRVKASLRTALVGFGADRMLRDYVERAYALPFRAAG